MPGANDDTTNVIERHELGTARWDIPDDRCTWCGSRVGPGHGWERVDVQGQELLRHTTPLYFDECTDHETRRALKRMGFCIVPVQRREADVMWLRQAGRNGWTVITTDKRIMEVPEEKQAVIDNRVRCFILSPQPEGTWATVRAFVTMWEKIRLESAFPGPAVWTLDDTYPVSRWEQLVPPPLEYKPIDFSRTPAGHLLNLFADVVMQHDRGWWTTEFVNALHDEIRVELESRIHGVRVAAPVRSRGQEWNHLLGARLGGEAPQIIEPDGPIDMSELRVVLMQVETESGWRYQWLSPAHKVPVAARGDEDRRMSITLDLQPKGFHRSGVGMPLPQQD